MSARLIFAALAVLSLLIGIGGYVAGQAYCRADAMESGAGHYTPDGREWKWGKK